MLDHRVNPNSKEKNKNKLVKNKPIHTSYISKNVSPKGQIKFNPHPYMFPAKIAQRSTNLWPTSNPDTIQK